MSIFRTELRNEGYVELEEEISGKLEEKHELIQKIIQIRNQSIGHNQHDLPAKKVYEINGITPNQIRGVSDSVAWELGESSN